MPEKQIADDKILRRDYERLRIGHELARAVGSELDLDKLLPKILDKAFELVGADRGVILLADDKGDMKPRFVKTRSGKSDPNIVLSKTVMAEVKNNKAAVLSSDATMDARFSGAHSIIMQGIRSTMTLPLLLRERAARHHAPRLAVHDRTRSPRRTCRSAPAWRSRPRSRSRTRAWRAASRARPRRAPRSSA